MKYPTGLYINAANLENLAKVLVRFSIQHGQAEESIPLQNIKNCTEAIKNGNFKEAQTHYSNVGLGKEDFRDWVPQPVYEHEDKRDVSITFQALLNCWCSLVEHASKCSKIPHVKMKFPTSLTVTSPRLQDITAVLIRFCIQHGQPEESLQLQSMKNCAKAIEENNLKDAQIHYFKVGFQRDEFCEWVPQPVYEHEKKGDARNTFEALLNSWSFTVQHVKIDGIKFEKLKIINRIDL